MTIASRSVASLALLAASGFVRVAAGRAEMPAAAAAELGKRLDAYVALHRRAAATVPSRGTTDDPTQVVNRRKALAAAIRAARPDARQGMIFTPAVEAEYRRIIRADFHAREPDDRAAVRREVPQLPFAVDDDYPDDAPHATVPPMLLARLPRLPKELAYRFFGRHLILLDVDANLIVDYIPNALPPAAH